MRSFMCDLRMHVTYVIISTEPENVTVLASVKKGAAAFSNLRLEDITPFSIVNSIVGGSQIAFSDSHHTPRRGVLNPHHVPPI